MSAVVVDTSVWIEFLSGRPAPSLEDALADGLVVLPPVVVAELISGATRARDRAAIADLVSELPLCETPLSHWIRVGELRRTLLRKGISVSAPDAHIAQCTLDVEGLLLSRDDVFARIGGLRVLAG